MVIGKAMIFRQVADALSNPRRTNRETEQARFSRSSFRDAKQDLDKSGLAGAVLPKQAEDFSGLDSQAYAFQSVDLAVLLDKTFYFDDRHGSGSRECNDWR